MFKALLKKQLLEINSYLFQNKKTGKLYSKGKIALFVALYGLLFAFIGVSCFFAVGGLCKALSEAGLSWLYFALVGLGSLAVGVFGSVFNTYASLYRAKDNDLLLSMPIQPFKILATRIIGVFFSALLYQSIVYIPALIARFIYAPVTVGGVAASIILWFVMGALATFFTLILGWVVAAISARLKNKTAVTVILFILFFGLYYYAIMKAGDYITKIIGASENIAAAFKSWVYPFYCFGIAAEGNYLAVLGFSAATALLLFLACFIMAKTFINITTGAKSANKVRYKEKRVKVKPASRALFSREAKRLFSSATVFLNCSMSSIMSVFLAVLLFINKGTADRLFTEAGDSANMVKNLLLLIFLAVCLMVTLLNNIGGPSVSLEAKTLDITRSLPVKTSEFLWAKQKLHIIMTATPVAVFAVSVAVVLRFSAIESVLFAVNGAVFVLFGSAFSLALGLKFPNLKWTNETVAVKQGTGNMLAILGGMGIAVLLGAGLYGLGLLIPVEYCMIVSAALFAALTAWLNVWIIKRGAEIFESL